LEKGLKTVEAGEAIWEVEIKGTTTQQTTSKWFKRFKEGDFALEDKHRSGRPAELENEELIAALEEEPSSSSRELATDLGVDHKTILNHLHQLDFVHKKSRQDPHELTEAQANRR